MENLPGPTGLCQGWPIYLDAVLQAANLGDDADTSGLRADGSRVPRLGCFAMLSCLYMLYAAVAYAGALALLGVVPLGLGVPRYLISRAPPR